MPTDRRPDLPQRRSLPHDVPSWVLREAVYFITICAIPRGENHLCTVETGTALLETTQHRQGLGLWFVHLCLLMPDHVHALLSFPLDADLVRVVRAWKRYTARWFGLTWQKDFFEHRLRHDESLREKEWYIRLNPVRAGLVEDPDAWPYVWPR